MAAIYGADAYSPKEIARKVEEVGVVKARAPFMNTMMLGILAGGFIGMGGMYATMLVAGAEPNPALRLAAGLVFSTGYVVAILAGAEVFTSNNLSVMSYAAGKIRLFELLRNWSIVLMANAIGACGLGLLFVAAKLPLMDDGMVGAQAVQMATMKAGLDFQEAFFRGVLGNLFVCVAVWISLAGRSVADKVLAIMLPLSALAALQLEHVLASLYYLSAGYLTAVFHPQLAGEGVITILNIGNALRVLVAVTLGNIIGGSLMVGFVYYMIYRRNPDLEEDVH